MTSSTGQINSAIELYDQDIKKIAAGPMTWANSRVGSWRNVDDFHKGLTEQFEKIGLLVRISVNYMGECRCVPACPEPERCQHLVFIDDAYTFDAEIQGRINPESGFDYDQLKHEIQHNLLEIPGEEGVIKFDEKEFLRQHGGGKHGRHPY